jgi:hypothetical protein
MRATFILLLCIASCAGKKDAPTVETIEDSSPIKTNRPIGLVKPQGIEFDVDSVAFPDTLLPIHNIEAVLENKINAKVIFYPQEHKDFQLAYAPNNALMETLQLCYSEHRPLILSPDAIWMAICQGASIHINQHFDSLQHIVLQANRPKVIEVRNDNLDYGARYWAQLFDSLSWRAKQYTKSDFYSFFVSDFTTTTPIERTAYQIALLESFKQAFVYIGEAGCGIPTITLTGAKEDWLTIRKKLDKLNEIGLGYWADELRPVIQEFINVYDGKTNRLFWQNIYKDATEYASVYITGWFIKFFPYIRKRSYIPEETEYDEANEGFRVQENYHPNQYLTGDCYLLSTLETDNFPSGLSQIEMIYINHFKDEIKALNVFAGFFAVKQYEDKTLEPYISWAVSDKSKHNRKEIRDSFKYSQLSPYKYWAPHVVSQKEDLLAPAIYDSKHYPTQDASLEYIKQYLEEKIRGNSAFIQKDFYFPDSLSFVVLSSGKITDVKLDGNNKELETFIEKQLAALPALWQPAVSYLEDVLLDAIDVDEKGKTIKINVNSKIKLGIFQE